MPAIRLRVEGRVQGVGFRWYVRENARRHGLSGWVRNLTDGSVELIADGPAETLAQFVERVRIGPAGASVRNLMSQALEDVEELPFPFTVLK
ncbi:MAG: acylphosphatase [Gemmatimonadaceae bacterium]